MHAAQERREPRHVRCAHGRARAQVPQPPRARRRGDRADHGDARGGEVRLEDVRVRHGTARGERREGRGLDVLGGAGVQRRGGVRTGCSDVGLHVGGVRGVEVDGRYGVHVGLERVRRGVRQHHPHAAGTGHLGGLLDPGDHTPVAHDDPVADPVGVERAGLAPGCGAAVRAAGRTVAAQDQAARRHGRVGGHRPDERPVVAEAEATLVERVRAGADGGHPGRDVAHRVRPGAAVAGRRRDEDPCRRGGEERARQGVGGVAGTGDGVAEHVHAVGDRTVHRRDHVRGGAAVVRRVRRGPAGLVDREARGRRHPAVASEVLPVDGDVDPGLAGGDRGDVRAVPGGVARREQLGARQSRAVEAVDEPARGDDLGVAVVLGPALRGGACAVEPRQRAGPSRMRLGQPGEAGVLGPDPAVDHADDDVLARTAPPARGTPRAAGSLHAEQAPRVAGRAVHGVALHQGDVGVGAQRLDLLLVESDREPVQRGGEAVDHRRIADPRENPVLADPQRGLEPSHGGAGAVEARAGRRAGPGVVGRGPAGQRHEVEPGLGGPRRVPAAVRRPGGGARGHARRTDGKQQAGGESHQSLRTARTRTHEAPLSCDSGVGRVLAPGRRNQGRPRAAPHRPRAAVRSQ